MNALFWLATPAFAQEAVCAEHPTHVEWAAVMDNAEGALARADLRAARECLAAAHRAAVCLTEPARPSYLARLGRDLALVFFFEQEEDATQRWAWLSSDADPTLAWPSDLPADHPFRASLAPLPAVGGPGGLGLVVPKGGFALLNGRVVNEPRARLEVPGLLQLLDKKGAVVRTVWQDGTAFPDDLIGPATGPWPALPPESAEGRARPRDPLLPASPVAPAATAPPPIAVPGYIDPFQEAALRAVEQDRSVRSDVDGTGRGRTVTTEVTTFVVASVGAVRGKDFADWVAFRPEWAREAAIAAGRADDRYLSDHVAGKPAAPDGPAVWVSFDAARAYCDDWAHGMEDVAVPEPAPVVTEWRLLDGFPARRTPGGAASRWEGATTVTAADVGFRCVE